MDRPVYILSVAVLCRCERLVRPSSNCHGACPLAGILRSAIVGYFPLKVHGSFDGEAGYCPKPGDASNSDILARAMRELRCGGGAAPLGRSIAGQNAPLAACNGLC